jgi:REP element-mobilizing transposase RayT
MFFSCRCQRRGYKGRLLCLLRVSLFGDPEAFAALKLILASLRSEAEEPATKYLLLKHFVFCEMFYLYHMAVDKRHIFEPGIYFVTFTNYKWLHLFEITKSYDLVYKWFDVLRSNGNAVIGYVIMPNHVHVMIGYKSAAKSINTIVGNGKRFIAYEMIERLKAANNAMLLKVLSSGVSAPDKQKGQLHRVFEPSFDLKLCRSYKFVKQKLDYMHSNPVSKKWTLAANSFEYIHSSARFYETDVQGIYEVSHVNQWINDHWFCEPLQQ